jgi:protein tyrosine/serine phosphatase
MLYYIYNILYDFLYTDISVNEIIPGLWLGNYKSALDNDFLKQNKIDLIINCTPNIPFIDNAEDLKIETYRIPVNDSLLEKDFILMEKYFKIAIPMLLRKYTIENKKILIHCHMGKQRSAILTAALLKVLIDNNNIRLPEIPVPQDNQTQFEYICNYLLSKRYQVFTYGLRINFEPTYKRFFKIF